MDENCWDAFGDEGASANARFALFSFIAFQSSLIPTAVEILRRAKSRFGVPETARLHCRVLFSGMQRSKTEWKFLTSKQPIEIVKYLGVELLGLKPCWSYGYVDLKELGDLPSPEFMKFTFPSVDGAPRAEASMPFRDKQAQRFAYLAASLPLRNRLSNVQFWIDQDASRVEWFNKKSGQAHNLNPLIPASIDLPSELAPMLEIADLFAYVAGRHLAGDERLGWTVFRSIHRRFGPLTTKFNFDPAVFGGPSKFFNGADMIDADQLGAT